LNFPGLEIHYETPVFAAFAVGHHNRDIATLKVRRFSEEHGGIDKTIGFRNPLAGMNACVPHVSSVAMPFVLLIHDMFSRLCTKT
jgi:hypothetical protein